MPRSWAELRGSGRFSSSKRAGMGMYSQTAGKDSIWTFRMANKKLKHPLAGSPMQPGLPVDAHTNLFEFKTAYDVDTTNVWDETNDGAGTGLTVQDGRGGKAKVTNNAANDKYYFYQGKYEIDGLVAGKGLWLIGSIEIVDADEADWFWGLCERLGSGNLFDNRVDAIGFYGSDGSASINCESKKSTATQETAQGTLADATEVELAIYADGTRGVWFYIDNAFVTVISTTIPTDLMAISFGIRNGTGEANALTVGQITLIQDN